LIVKFDDDAQVRVRSGQPTSLAGFDLGEIERTLVVYSYRAIEPLLSRSELAVDATRAAAEARSGRRLPDLNSYHLITVPAAESEGLLQALRRSPLVRAVYRAPLPQPPPVDIPPPTPDGEADQIYIEAAPEGIDARDAWTRPGGRGEGVFLVDIEYDWRDNHEDLESALGQQFCFTPNTPTEIEHGTAVIGQIVGGDNGYGITGIASQVEIGLVTHSHNGTGYNVAQAIDCATGLMGPGDVMLIEAQTVGPHGDFVPVEWDQAEFDAISIASAAGIVVVEAAGNGGENLDHVDFLGAFDRSVRDSGALIVGAGANLYYIDQADRSRLEFSTYGSRVDLQGWGDDVLTTGYGDVFDGGGDPNQYYTEVFNGTSSASPMIAGAVAAIQGVQMACGGNPLAPSTVRDLLVDTGSPQVAGPYPGNIGPRPDLRGALMRVDVDNDTDGFAECHGDCDDGVAATYPGATETNDGLDNDCPGEPGFGLVDEISGTSGFLSPANKTEYSWPQQAGALSYEVSRSDAADFSSGCMSWQTTTTFINDGTTPSVGAVFYYLTRSMTPSAGSWGRTSSGVERFGDCL
jgi:hypothetical protein